MSMDTSSLDVSKVSYKTLSPPHTSHSFRLQIYMYQYIILQASKRNQAKTINDKGS